MFVDSLVNMPEEEVLLKQKEIVGKFPNTYTFTKNIGEKLLKKHRGDLPLVIIRPSIIGAAEAEPFPGWVDSISAGTAVYLTGALGVLRDLCGRVDIIGDQIPVDHCAHLIIAATADSINKNRLMIYHSASSSRNPITWIQTLRYFWTYIARNSFEKKVQYPDFDMYQSKYLHNFVFFVKREIPANGYYYASKLLGNPKMKKTSEKYLKVLNQCKMLGKYFTHFTTNEWIYDTFNSYQLKSRLEEEDLANFRLDILDLDWKAYFPIFAYGMQKYLMKEDAEPPFGPRNNIVSTRPRFVADLAWVFAKGMDQTTRDPTQIRKIVLNSEKVRMAIREIVKNEMMNSTVTETKLLKIQEARGNEIVDRMAAKMSFSKMRSLGYIMHKAFKNMYEKVVINNEAFEEIRALNERKDISVIYCPTHRSYVDFLILSYVLYANGIKVPHICAGEDFLNIAVVHTFLRSSGAFFMKRSFRGDPLYKAIFTTYVQSLLSDTHSLEFFLEGTRARSGKMMNPKFGLLNILTDAYFTKKVENYYFVPVTLNYSRVLEGETFPLEILGESKVKESLGRIVNASRYISMNFGDIYVEVAEPINFKNYVQDQIQEKGLNPDVNKADQKLITNSLGYQLIYRLMDNLIIMPTSICASILLMHRKGISEDELIKQVGYLIDVLKSKNAILPSYCNRAESCVKKGTYHLNETVSKKKDIFEPRVIPKVDYKNILLLSYYRNNLIHLFINEAFISCALFGFGHHKCWEQGVDRKDLFDKVIFISTLLRNEFVLKTKFKTMEDLDKMIEYMIFNKTLMENENGMLIIHPEGENHLNFLNSLIWPFIDTYWVTFVFIFSLVPSKFVQESKIHEKIQWFAQSLHDDQIISFFESCSQEITKNAVSTFYADGIIVKKKLETISDGVKDPSVYTLADEYNDEDKMQQFFERISHYRKSTLVKMSNMSNIRKTLLSDFPFMAKM